MLYSTSDPAKAKDKTNLESHSIWERLCKGEPEAGWLAPLLFVRSFDAGNRIPNRLRFLELISAPNAYTSNRVT